MRQKIIFTDCDGTILNHKGAFSALTIDTIKKIYQQNNLLILTTARRLSNTKILAKQSGIDSFKGIIIANNGAQIYDFNREKLILNKTIKHKVLKKIFNLYFKTPRISNLADIDFISENFIYTSNLNQDNVLWANKTFQKITKIQSLDEIKEPITNVRIFFNKRPSLAEYEKVFNIFADLLKTKVAITGNQRSVIAFAPKNVSKGEAIKYVLKYLKSNDYTTYAFGDNFNDLSMYPFVNYFIAVKNSQPEVIKIADSITEFTNDEDGVVKYLYSQNII